MATSGTTDFTLDIVDICEEAYERAGLEMRSGYDLKTARRSLNLMSIEWINRGLNLWTIEEGTQAITAGTETYDFPPGTIDFLDQMIRTDAGETNSQSDTSVCPTAEQVARGQATTDLHPEDDKSSVYFMAGA